MNHGILAIRHPEEPIRLWQKTELHMVTETPDGNPFNPDELAVEAALTSPSGVTMTVPGFWFQPFSWSREKARTLCMAQGTGGWRLRFCLREAGRWKVCVRLLVRQGLYDTAETELDALPAEGKGFIRVEPTAKRTFVFDNGELYVPVGQNLAWNRLRPQNETAGYYCDILEKMAGQGCNFVRSWLAQWNLSLNDITLPPDDYSKRMDKAAVLDEIFAFMEQNNLHISLVIWSHGQFSVKADPAWVECCYNAKNPGGYLEHPQDFFTDEQARADAKKYIRYILARYGYSTSLFCWELFNEADGSAGRINDMLAWHKEMADYIRKLDPYGHLISTSSCIVTCPLITDESMDFIYLHSYNIHGGQTSIDQIVMPLWYQFRKPIVYGEIGLLLPEYEIDPGQIVLHQELWAGLLGGTAGTAMNWFWESADEQNVYAQFTPAARFSSLIPWKDPDLKHINRYFLGIYSEQICGYGYHREDFCVIWLFATQYDHRHTQATNFGGVKMAPRLPDGQYEIAWFDTYKGEFYHTDTFAVSELYTELVMPPWSRDTAFLIKRK